MKNNMKNKMMNLKHVLNGAVLVSVLLAATVSKAGYEHGNGGGMVVCKHALFGGIKSVELLDFYEARTLRNMTIDMGDEKKPWKEQVQAVLNRIRPISEFRYQLYGMWLQTFEAESKQLQNAEFSTIPDAFFIALPKHCSYVQAAVQRPPLFDGDARYFLNADLWKKMSERQRAGLVLHEMVYREAMGYGHNSSVRARFVVGILTGKSDKELTARSFARAIQQSHFEIIDLPNPSSHKISQKITVSQLWQPGVQTGTPEELTFDDRVILQAGKCEGEECANYKDFSLDTVFAKEGVNESGFYAPFYNRTNRVWIDQYQFEPILFVENHIAGAKTDLYLTVYPNRENLKIEGETQDPIDPKSPFTFFRFVNESNANWLNVNPRNVNLRSFSVSKDSTIFEAYNFDSDSFQFGNNPDYELGILKQCVAKLVFVDGKLLSLKYDGVTHGNDCRLEFKLKGDPLPVSLITTHPKALFYYFENGKFKIDPAAGEFPSFDILSFQSYGAGGGNYYNYQCLKDQVNCLMPRELKSTGDLTEVTAFGVPLGTAVVEIEIGNVFSSRPSTKYHSADSLIQLYPSGAPMRFVVSEPTEFSTETGTPATVTAPAGATIHLNEQGKLTHYEN